MYFCTEFLLFLKIIYFAVCDYGLLSCYIYTVGGGQWMLCVRLLTAGHYPVSKLTWRLVLQVWENKNRVGMQ